MTSREVMTVIRRALNRMDYRIVDHGQRVAFIVYKMLQKEGTYSKDELHKICVMSELHDIGAYKTEDNDTLGDVGQIMAFEFKDTLNHSAYGYLFLKNFSILGKYADAILYHHVRYDEVIKGKCVNKDLAAKIFLADRIDMMARDSAFKINGSLLEGYRNTVFSGSNIELLIGLEKELGLLELLVTGKYMEEMDEVYQDMQFTKEELHSFLKLLSYLVDFRSEYTVLHIIATVRFSVEIAKLMGFSDLETEKIYYGALLHDVGKIATSVLVLEKDAKLDDFEYKIMKDHVIVSELILKGCVADDILQIAIRHHEKLDGSGYPKGLSEKDLSQSEKIVCVADILSALYGKRSYKEQFSSGKILAILKDMAEKNKISKEIVGVVVNNYGQIIRNVEENCYETIRQYEQMHAQYVEITSR